MDANKKWISIPKKSRSQLIKNVFCVNCTDAVTIERFTIEEDQFGIVIKGKRKNCGHEVVRVLEI